MPLPFRIMILSSFNFPIKISYYEIYFFLMALGNSTTYSVDKVSLCHKQLQKNLLSLSMMSKKPQSCRSTPVSTALCWSPHHWHVEKWWLGQWSFPPFECCHWPPPTWRQWSRCGDRWGCSLWLCSGHDGHSRTSLTGPVRATAREDRQT